nr:50S ribosomal protein L10 [Campylobacter mucosalis]
MLEITGRKGEDVTRNEKSEVIAKLESEFKNAQAIVVCDYRGLSVKKLEALRNAAREQNVKVQVVKNTLAKIALKNVEKEGMDLKDTNIYVWGEDQLSVTKVVAKFEETNQDLFKIKTAHIEGEVASVEKVKALSKMPSRDELIAMLLQVWNAPIQNFTIGLNALKEKKEQSA